LTRRGFRRFMCRKIDRLHEGMKGNQRRQSSLSLRNELASLHPCCT